MLNIENNPAYLQIIIAFVVDLAIGDPYWFPHPVKGIGKIIQIMESKLRRFNLSDKFAGAVLAVVVVVCVYFMTLLLVELAGVFGKISQATVSITIIYFSLSVRGLVTEAKKIVLMLKKDNLQGARQGLSNIVGRDTANLKTDQVKRACIESLSENMVDGIIAPLFFAFIGGAPLAMAYKAINTLDSMVGYKNDRYIKFGWASARLDDIANFIPARITIGLVPIASYICASSPLNSLRIWLRDGHKHPSPNSGIPEALFAGALRIQLGGDCSYNGVNVKKSVIGDSLEIVTVKKILKAIQLVYVCSGLAIAFGVAAFLIVD
ncbi:MAG: adenosylcobinamide-phosphate synthase CbiB [Candidatus Anammoxibacter sp.]